MNVVVHVTLGLGNCNSELYRKSRIRSTGYYLLKYLHESTNIQIPFTTTSQD